MPKSMARLPRSLTVLPGFSVHKIWRGHNRENNLNTPEEKSNYLQFLNEDLESEKFQSGAVINALTLMSNHAHEIFEIGNPDQFSNHMRRHHSRFGAYFNRTHQRSGKVAEDRPKTCLLENERSQMIATFYVHANPVRAKMVRNACQYPWSTHRFYAFGKRAEWMRNIVLPSWYRKLGKNNVDRQRKYRKLFDAYIKREGLAALPQLLSHSFGSPLWQLARNELVQRWHREQRPP